MEEPKHIWLLDNVQIARPCPKRWDEMQGDNARRYCDGCGHHVYNFSGMTRDEAEALVRESEGRFCARFYRREDGSVMTSDCPKTDEVPQPQGFLARMEATRLRKQYEKHSKRIFPDIANEIPHLTGIIARPTPWTANSDQSSTRTHNVKAVEGTEVEGTENE